tara:strand:+ start:121 stop:2079 length:1959 start_codon:yes stop_codon:yes gene_type:complete
MRSENTTRLPTLGNSNELVCVDGVWRQASPASGIDYSDGQNEESILYETLAQAKNLAWNSPEFAGPYGSWAQEYHLSPLRANLLRGLRLPEAGRVLEIGAGCGAVTRFLGDQGFRVDAVEGSASRARLAYARCAGLDNVSIISADFHGLQYPKESYDLVLFIGVLEYAQRFAPDGLSSREAVIRMLTRAMQALSADGKIIIAIENRLGAKYLSGWPEDHLGTSWSGVAGYPVGSAAEAGIRTFDKSEWEGIFRELQLKHRSFYPLPDYKLPEAFIREGGHDAPGANVIYGRYVSVNRTPAPLPSGPARFQQNALYRAGLLSACADSFGIVVARSDEELEGLMPHDWIIFGAGADSMEKDLCIKSGANAPTAFTSPNPNDRSITLPQGEPIFQHWLKRAASGTSQEEFSKLLAGHLRRAVQADLRVPGWCLMASDTGELVPEIFPWPSEGDPPSGIDDQLWATSVLDEFFEFAKTDLESLVDLGSWEGVEVLKQQVLERLGDLSVDSASGERSCFAAIYWASGEAFSEEQKSTHRSSGQGREVLRFNLPEPVRADMRLRFDPSDQETGSKTVTVKLESMLLFGAQDSSGVDLMPAMKRVGVDACNQCELKPTDDGVILIIQGNDPWVVIDLAPLGLPSYLSLERVEAHLDWGS